MVLAGVEEWRAAMAGNARLVRPMEVTELLAELFARQPLGHDPSRDVADSEEWTTTRRRDHQCIISPFECADD